MCCPKGYKVEFTEPVPGSKGMFYQTSFDGVLTNVYSTSSLEDGSAPDNPPLQTVTAADFSSAVGWQDVIQIRWTSTDTDILAIMASTSAANSPAATAAIASSTASAPPSCTITISPNSGSNTLDGSDIAKITAGVVAGCITFLMLGFFVGLKKGRSQI